MSRRFALLSFLVFSLLACAGLAGAAPLDRDALAGLIVPPYALGEPVNPRHRRGLTGARFDGLVGGGAVGGSYDGDAALQGGVVPTLAASGLLGMLPTSIGVVPSRAGNRRFPAGCRSLDLVGLVVSRLRLVGGGGPLVGHALLEVLDALGDVAHQFRNVAAAKQHHHQNGIAGLPISLCHICSRVTVSAVPFVV